MRRGRTRLSWFRWWMCGQYAWAAGSIVCAGVAHILDRWHVSFYRRIQAVATLATAVYAAILWDALGSVCDAWLGRQTTDPTVAPRARASLILIRRTFSFCGKSRPCFRSWGPA